jgi:hypothetical protein
VVNRVWTEVTLAEGYDSSLSIGDFDVRVIHKDGGARFHFDGRALEGTVESAGWRDVSLPPGDTLRFVPRTPDLPVVLRSDEPIVLGVTAAMEFEVLLPVWMEIRHAPGTARKREESVLFDIPSRSLKRSWFGTPESGEVAYAWSFSPETKRRYQRHLLAVPVRIVNRSNSPLRFERFLLRVVHLAVYRIGDRLATNEVTVNFKGSEQLSVISFEPSESVVRRGGELLSAPRENSGTDMIRKSFGWLRELAV